MSPSNRSLTASLAILAATVGVSAVAGSAQALPTATPDAPGALVDSYPFSMNGDPDTPLEDATVAFWWGNGRITPQLTGTLHVLNGVNAKYRVQVKSFDKNGDRLGTVYDDPDGTRVQKDPKDIPVDLDATTASGTSYVKVALQKDGSSDSWKTKDAYYVTLHPPRDDDVTILGSGIDVGGAGFAAGAPTEPAKVTWKIGDDGRLTATYSGYLHVDRFPGIGRVVIRAVDATTGREAARAEGDAQDPPDNAHHRYPETGGPETLSVTSSTASKLEVDMQSWVITDPLTGDGEWQDVGTQAVNVAE